MSLQILVDNLRALAGHSGQVTIGAGTFLNAGLTIGEDFDRLLQRAFMLPAGQNLAIRASSSSIPDPQGDGLTFRGTASVLNVDNVPTTVTVTVPANRPASVTLAFALPDAWKFENSFSHLNGYPFTDLRISSPSFIFVNEESRSYTWNNETIAVEPGLNFASFLNVSGFGSLLQLLTDLIGSKTSHVFFGTLDPGTIQLQPATPAALTLYPAMELQVPLSDRGISIEHLSIGEPRILLRIDRGAATEQQVWLLIQLMLKIGGGEADSFSLPFQALLMSDERSFGFGILPDPSHAVTIEDVITLVGGVRVEQYIPSALADIFKTIGLKGFYVEIDPSAMAIYYLSVAVGTVKPWALNDIFKLDDITLRLTVFNPSTTKFVSVFFDAVIEFFPKIFKGNFEIEITASTSGDLTIVGKYRGTVSLNDLVAGISGNTVVIPSDLVSITFSNFFVSFSKSQQGYSYSLSSASDVNFQLPFVNGKVDTSVQVAIQSSPGQSPTFSLLGGLIIGSANFNFSLNLGGDNRIEAGWTAINDNYLELRDIAKALSLELPEIPEDMDLGLKSAKLIYDFKGTFALTAESANYGKAVFLAGKPGGQWELFFGLSVDKTINLSNLPLIGQELAKLQTLQVDHIQVAASSRTLDKAAASAIDALIPAGYPHVPSDGMSFLAGLSLNLDFGKENRPLNLTFGGRPPTGGTDATVAPGLPVPAGAQAENAQAPLPTPTSGGDGTTWLNIQKTFGPVGFQRIGVKYEKQILRFLLDASLAMDGLSLQLQGLSIGSPLKSFDPRFDLDGIGVDYHNGPLEIGGGLFKIPPQPPVTWEYAGDVVIRIAQFTITAAADYASLSGTPSFFIFGQVRGAFGGPPCFFVTGIAAGIGYNKTLRIPGQDEVMDFPLVAGLSSPDALGGKNPTPQQALAALLGTGGKPGWLQPQIGQMWIAAGLSFKSFELVSSNVLLLVEFGNEFALALIGLSVARFPQTGPVTYAYVELQIEAVFKPSEGFLSVTAVLSRNSFLLDPACHLTGGFAFCLWFEKSGHEGDFVITVGGYSPYFNPPKWYPQEPRVGFNWSLCSKVSITGGAYFALTPSAIMAGGALAVIFQDGNLKAWFTAHVDIIVFWKPFYFVAGIGVSVGVSYRMDLLFTSVTLKVELGADLQLWGPPTGGTVTVHLWIISFTVNFGGDMRQNQAGLDWHEFSSLLPPSTDVCKIMATGGLHAAQKDAQGQVGKWFVRPDNFRFTTSSAVPSCQLYAGSSDTPVQEGDKLNIRPMQVQDLTSTHRVSLTRDRQPLDLSNWKVEALRGNVPKALWGKGGGAQLEQGDDQLVAGQLSGLSFQAPKPVLGSSPGEINIERDLGYDPLTPGVISLQSGLSPSGPLPAASTDTIQILKQTMTASDVKGRRDALYGTLQSLGADPGTNDPLDSFVASAGFIFEKEPMLVS